MLKVLKYLKKSWLFVVTVIILLGVQATADLNLPEYTSKIVNIGIQQNGIENSIPEVISSSTMEKVKFLSRNKELVDNNYSILVKGTISNRRYKYLSNKFPEMGNDVYILGEVNKEDEEKLNLELSKTLMFIDMLESKETSEKIKQALESSSENTEIDIQKFVGENAQILELMQNQGINLYTILKEMPEEMQNIIINYVYAQMDEMPDSIVEQSAISSVKKEYERLGANTEKIQNQYIIKSGIEMLGISLISVGCGILIILLSAKMAARLGTILREKVFKKVLTFSNAEYRKFGNASLITRNTNDIQQIQNLIPMLFRVVIYAPIMGIGGFIKVLTKSENSMAWIIGVAILAILFVVVSLFIIAMPKFKKLQNLIDKLNLVSRELLSGRAVIRAFNKEKFEEEKFETANKDLMKTNIFVNRCMSFMMPGLMFIMNAISLLIIWNGSFKVDGGIMQVGDLMAFIQYTMQIVISFLFISMLSIILPRASVSANRITEVLDQEVLIQDSKKLVKFDDNKKGIVEFKNVSFKYPDADTEILTDISFVAKPGEVTAIIGGTGSGKSTVVNLIPRFYDVTGGEIIIDGVNIKDVSQKDLRDIIGFVPQKGVLFSGTIESNIKYSNENMDDFKMIKAAQIAQAEEFINEKVDKYKSEISQGGTNVSGGQKQRLSIARAIAKEPEIYVFDDSFSALDLKTDLKLRKALEEITVNKTVIIVAQRINTIINANKIIVLDEGKIVGKGTHKELLENNEVYQQIALSQLSKEELENG